ncbi:hypothetical protein BASA61_003073 [Batrachochytrium salamandrivorans]|nr:hypothetical protein BASA61_003073 [Batrachochytrium salamandrivorans]
MDCLDHLDHCNDYYVPITPPFVRYQCHCAGQSIFEPISRSRTNHSRQGGDRAEVEGKEHRQSHSPSHQSPPAVPANSLELHSIELLLFCTVCNQLRCDGCTTQEVSCCYCPNCMFEVPTTSVKTERGSCGRNCFNCPLCGCIATVANATAPEGSTTADGRSSSNSVMSGGTYYLSCSTCRWDSTESGLRFERPTGLAAYITKLDSNSPQVLEHENLLEHYVETLRMFRPYTLGSGAGYGSSFDRYGLGAAASTAYMHSALLDPSIRSMRIKPDKRAVAYEPLLKPSGQSIDPVAQINQIPYENRTSLEQRLWHSDGAAILQVQQLRPVRVQLRSKRTKRCLGCEHILVKPEIKAASIRFGIKMTARDKIPRIRIVPPLPPSPLVVGEAIQCYLRIINPLPHAIQVHLEHPEDPPSICLMHIHEPRFTLAAFSDSWELHEPSSYGASDSVSGAQSQLDGTVAPVDACAVAGPHERLIVISFTPTAPVSEIQLLIKVTFSTQPKDDMPQGISDPGVAHNEDLGSDKVVDNEISFWVVVGVGSSGSTSIEKTTTSAQIQDGSSTESDDKSAPGLPSPHQQNVVASLQANPAGMDQDTVLPIV